jgi:O-antigen/teichoic acid export membrane protein
VQLLVLARLLDKSAFGMIAIGQAALQICLQIQNSMLNNAILHRQETEPAALSALYWWNAGVGIFFGLLLWCLASPIAWYYEKPDLISVARWLSLIPITEGLSNTMKVIWQKEMAFKKIGRIEMAAVLLSFVASLTMAIQGMGWKALVGGFLVRHATEAILYVGWRPPFLPAFHFRLENASFYFRASTIQSAERLVTMASAQLDTILIGKLLGLETLGLYDILKRLLVRPSNLLNHLVERVTLPLFAKLQVRPLFLRNLFLQTTAKLAALNLAGYSAIAVFAGNFLYFAFGKSWEIHSLEVRLMCVFVLIQALLNPIDALLVAVGKIEKWLVANLIFLPFLALSIWIGCQFQLAGSLLAMTLSYLFFLLVVWQVIVKKTLGKRKRHFLSAKYRT